MRLPLRGGMANQPYQERTDRLILVFLASPRA